MKRAHVTERAAGLQRRFVAALRQPGLPVSVVTDGAAALTYYTVLSLFPGIALLTSLLALVGGGDTAETVIDAVREIAPPDVADTLAAPIERMATDEALSGAALGLGTVIAVFSASRYVVAFGRVADRVQGVDPTTGPVWRRRPLAMLLVAAMVALLPLALLALLITGPIAVAVGDAVGLSSTVRDLFAVLRWPLLGIVGAAMLTILYLSSEGMRQAGPRRVLPGALAAIAIWLAASGLFAVYVANLTSFSLTYGSLAGVVVFLVWLYVSNLAVLAGMVVNAARIGTLPRRVGPTGAR